MSKIVPGKRVFTRMVVTTETLDFPLIFPFSLLRAECLHMVWPQIPRAPGPLLPADREILFKDFAFPSEESIPTYL